MSAHIEGCTLYDIPHDEALKPADMTETVGEIPEFRDLVEQIWEDFWAEDNYCFNGDASLSKEVDLASLDGSSKSEIFRGGIQIGDTSSRDRDHESLDTALDSELAICTNCGNTIPRDCPESGIRLESVQNKDIFRESSDSNVFLDKASHSEPVICDYQSYDGSLDTDFSDASSASRVDRHSSSEHTGTIPGASSLNIFEVDEVTFIRSVPKIPKRKKRRHARLSWSKSKVEIRIIGIYFPGSEKYSWNRRSRLWGNCQFEISKCHTIQQVEIRPCGEGFPILLTRQPLSNKFTGFDGINNKPIEVCTEDIAFLIEYPEERVVLEKCYA
jgi:hypothetical protein